MVCVEIIVVDVLCVVFCLVNFDICKFYWVDGSFVLIYELDDEIVVVIEGVDIIEEWEGIGEDCVFVGYMKKYKIVGKNLVLDKLFKYFGLYEFDNK